MKVPFLELKQITEKYKTEIHEAALRVIDNGWYLQGNLSTYLPAQFCHSFAGCRGRFTQCAGDARS